MWSPTLRTALGWHEHLNERSRLGTRWPSRKTLNECTRGCQSISTNHASAWFCTWFHVSQKTGPAEQEHARYLLHGWDGYPDFHNHQFHQRKGGVNTKIIGDLYASVNAGAYFLQNFLNFTDFTKTIYKLYPFPYYDDVLFICNYWFRFLILMIFQPVQTVMSLISFSTSSALPIFAVLFLLIIQKSAQKPMFRLTFGPKLERFSLVEIS